MTRPNTGTTFTAGGFNDVDNRFQTQRTGLVAALFRDARGEDTDISPHNSNGSVRWSPLATDGQLRDDLFAWKRVNGVWVLNEDDNEGWFSVGAFAEGDGPSSKPSFDTDDQMIEQSNWPFDTDTTKQDEPFSFTALEQAKPPMRRLRNNLPLVDSNGDPLVELPGAADAGWGQPLDPNTPDRQWLLVTARKRGGKVFYDVDGYSCAKLTGIGESRRGKKGTAAALTYKPQPDGYFMAMVDGEYIPIIKYTWHGGDAWAALGDSAVGQYLVTVGAASAGTFTLTYKGQTTAGIAYNAAAAAVKSALVALDDGYDAADWTVSGSAGGPYTVTTPGGAITGSGSGLTGGSFSVAAA